MAEMRCGDMDCEKALTLLQDYLKQELTPETRQQVREHLHRCAPCLQHSRFEERFLELLHMSAGRQCCPDKVRARILELLRSEMQRD